MYIRQISVFMENRKGALAECITLLASHHIDLQAMTIAESADYGILRMIADKTDEALQLLADNHFMARETQVICVSVPDVPGSLTNILARLAAEGVDIHYSYAFFSRDMGRASLVLRVENPEDAMRVLDTL